MREHLGVEPRIAYCVDSFGHAGTLPQILRACGFDAYVFMRPGPHEKELPSQSFWWQGPDGSRILTFRIAEAYTTRAVEHAQHIQAAVEAMPPQLDRTMCFFGVGNHGGGPTKEQIENVRALAANAEKRAIRFSWPDAFFDEIAPDAGALPVVEDELQFHAVGCYAADSALKRAYRQAECQLLLAERMGSLAATLADRPAASLRTLWQTLCFNQFHDILGGSSIEAASEDAIRALNGVTAAAEQLVDDAGRAVAAQVNTAGPGGAFVLFNPHGHPTQDYVEYEPWTGWEPWRAGGWGLADEQGVPVPYQLIESREALSSARSAVSRLVFRAEVPAMGYRLYRFAPGMAQADVSTAVHATTAQLTNEHLEVTFDVTTGNITACRDRATGIDLVGPGGWNVGQVIEDHSDTWSHGVRRYGEPFATFGAAQLRVGDEGPLQASLFIARSFEGSRWLQQVVLRAGERSLLIRNWLHWQGEWRMVKLAFDVATATPQAAHDIPFGWRWRPCDGHEVPTQMWMDVSGPATMAPEQTIGAALLDDGKYGCDVRGSTMRLTILRCPPFAYHEPHAIGSKQRYAWMDQGMQAFTLRLCPHVGDWRSNGIVHAARLLNMPMVAVTTHAHAGNRPGRGSLLELSDTSMELTALKAAEDGDGLVVRVADRHGRGAEGTLHWLGRHFPVAVAPFEVATLRLQARNGQWECASADMLERTG
jgi:alpha-mannosidase